MPPFTTPLISDDLTPTGGNRAAERPPKERPARRATLKGDYLIFTPYGNQRHGFFKAALSPASQARILRLMADPAYRKEIQLGADLTIEAIHLSPV